ncbi:MAG: RecQ family ATP-dependent DNA helicase [Ktedonobacteraceae bacterium]
MMTPAAMWQSNPPEQLLKERFHITTSFHPGQRDIIEQLVMGKRLLVIQRTGWGKSLCYQMASLYYPHLTLVFSPLKALMRDQCQRCNDSYSIAAGMVSSEFSTEENRATLARAVEGKLNILFIAPERLDNADWQRSVSQMRISMIVIDEAHCISTWGHDFRPHYQRIVRLLSALPSAIPVLGLTATANARVEQDVLGQIGAGTQVIRGTMWRPNLHLNVVELRGDREKLSYLAEFLPHLPGTGIIYTATQHDAEMTAAFLQQQGVQAEYYHSRREEQVKRDIEQKFMANQYKVVCSTNALGMGIDKPDIRFVIHYQIPASPIHYYQEIGRAGRDTKVSWCVLLYDAADLAIQEHFNRTAKPEAKCYDFVMSLLQVIPQGLHDLMQLTGYAQQVVEHVLFDLQEQHLIERNAKEHTYIALPSLGKADFAAYDVVREQKKRELKDMQEYAQLRYCYMEYLTTYLGDAPGYTCRTCGNCRSSNFPVIKYPERIYTAAGRFLEEEYLPRIEKRGTTRHPEHEAGWSLSYHGGTRVGRLVRASKYEEAGPFPLSLLNRAVEVIRTRYPLEQINGIVSVPPTKSGALVETFARRIAEQLTLEYMPVIAKVRETYEQKKYTNWVQKKENVKAAFSISSPEQVAGRTFLLIDDIYDSGYMLREVGRTLMQAGAKAVYPFTITRTAHSDDQ